MMLDLNMPVINGCEFVEIVRSQAAWNDVPIFVLSSTHSPVEIEQILSRGADRFIRKPSHYDQYLTLSTAIARHVAGAGPWLAPEIISVARTEPLTSAALIDRVQTSIVFNRALCVEGLLLLESSRRCIEHSKRITRR